MTFKANILTFVVSILGSHVAIVVRDRTEKQVDGVHALWVIAMMADAHAFWNWAEVHFPRNSMGTKGFAFDGKLAVPELFQAPNPIPAIFGLFDFGPKALFDRGFRRARENGATNRAKPCACAWFCQKLFITISAPTDIVGLWPSSANCVSFVNPNLQDRRQSTCTRDWIAYANWFSFDDPEWAIQ